MKRTHKDQLSKSKRITGNPGTDKKARLGGKEVEVSTPKVRSGGYYFKHMLPEELFRSISSYLIEELIHLCQVNKQFYKNVNSYLEATLNTNYKPNSFFKPFSKSILPIDVLKIPGIFMPCLLFSINNLDKFACEHYIKIALFWINFNIDIWSNEREYDINETKNISQEFILMKFLERYAVTHNEEVKNYEFCLKLQKINLINFKKELSLEHFIGCDLKYWQFIDIFARYKINYSTQNKIHRFIINLHLGNPDLERLNAYNVFGVEYSINNGVDVSIKIDENNNDSILLIARIFEKHIIFYTLIKDTPEREHLVLLSKFIEFLSLHRDNVKILDIISNIVLYSYHKHECHGDADGPLTVLVGLARKCLIDRKQAVSLKDWVMKKLNPSRRLNEVLGHYRYFIYLLDQLIGQNLVEISSAEANFLKDYIICLFEKNSDYLNKDYDEQLPSYWQYAGFDDPIVRILLNELLKRNLIEITEADASLLKSRLLCESNPPKRGHHFIEFIFMLIDNKIIELEKEELTLLKNHLFQSIRYRAYHSITFQKRVLNFLSPLIEEKTIELNPTEIEKIKVYQQYHDECVSRNP